ncbi:MAG TPA: hypothetical protein PLI70_02025 [Gemmatimonadales bacterium]|nr:hypothetical protein [Gemmatimonadales bacterium]HRZ08371.1 hypothetical protein [Gemmatimonadales bacterium]
MSLPQRLFPRSSVLLASLLLTGALVPAGRAVAQAGATRAVFINRNRLPTDTLQMLESLFQVRVPDGRYWYDATSGGWGQEGGPTIGFTVAGLPIGGPLPANVSGGTTGVYVNGRQLPAQDLAGLQQLVGPIAPGRYWLDGQGYAGSEGGPPVANLRALASQLSRMGTGVNERYGGGAAAYGNLNTGIGVITDGEGGAAVFTP